MVELVLDQRKTISRDRRRVVNPDGIPSFRYAVHLARGSDTILKMRGLLVAFSERCGQPGTMEDLAYFLAKPGLLQRVPCLFLISKRQDITLEELELDDLLGALLLYEYMIFGYGIQAFASNDRSGRGTMLALPQQRLKTAAIFSRVLLDRGARAIMLSFRSSGCEEEANEDRSQLFEFLPAAKVTGQWTWRERSIPGYLPLAPTYNETLMQLGHKTRHNLRYYRGRAERELGCRGIVDCSNISMQEYLALNRESMFAVPDKVAAWRLDVMKNLNDPVMVGMRDRDGKLLAMMGGRRFMDRMEILWQMNLCGMRHHSLSTVMRSYCMEAEVARGTKRLYIEGGTKHSMHHGFVKEELVDLVVMRRSPLMKVLKKVAAAKIYSDNALGDLLREKSTPWYPC
jgi:hypothetical protein